MYEGILLQLELRRKGDLATLDPPQWLVSEENPGNSSTSSPSRVMCLAGVGMVTPGFRNARENSGVSKFSNPCVFPSV